MKEILRFLVTAVIICILLTLTIFTIKYTSLTKHLIFIDQNYIKNIDFLLKLIQIIIIKHHILIFFITTFLTPLFFMNSIRVKVMVTYGKGMLISIVLGLLFIIILVLFSQKDITTSEPKLYYSKEKIYKSHNNLKIGDKILFYSKYKDNRFSNILLSPPIVSSNFVLTFSFSGKLKNNKIILNDPLHIEEKGITLTKKKVIPYFQNENNVFTSIKKEVNNKINYINNIISYIPLLKYEEYLVSQINNFYKKNIGIQTLYKIISFLFEIIGIIIIFFSVGLILSTKNMPLLNLFTSFILGLLLVYLLTISYSLAEQRLDIVVKYINMPNIPGILILLISAILFLFAYMKYERIILQTQ